jgi:hypothetical protein
METELVLETLFGKDLKKMDGVQNNDVKNI